MALAQSKLTSQGQISVPAEIRRRLGVGPGSTLEWAEEDGKIVVRKAGKYTSLDIHQRLFPDGPPQRRTLKQLKKRIEDYIWEQHERGRY
jgi:antitoxin PrlF